MVRCCIIALASLSFAHAHMPLITVYNSVEQRIVSTTQTVTTTSVMHEASFVSWKVPVAVVVSIGVYMIYRYRQRRTVRSLVQRMVL